MVEETVRTQRASSPNKPIYLVGDSFGGCLALAVAAHNPTIDLVLVLANLDNLSSPIILVCFLSCLLVLCSTNSCLVQVTTAFDRSQLQPLLPLLESLPYELHFTAPYLLSFIIGKLILHQY